MNRVKIIAACLGLLTSAFAPAFAAETPEQFPQRPIKLIVPWAPGGFTDSLARLVSEQMTRVLGQNMIVENRPGANGIIGTESVARSAPDGYTLLIATAETHAINPSTYPRLRYDAVADFAPVGSIGSVPLLLVTNVDLPEKTFPELMAAAKKTAGKFKYASWGAGSTGHLAFELLNAPAGVEMIHVPYKGLGPALTDVMSGQEDMTMATILSSEQFVKAGRLRPLAVTSPRRSALLPQVPTVAEMGYPGYDVALWYGIVAPARTPAAIVNRLNAALREAVKDASFKARMTASDADILVRSPQEFADFLAAERTKWARAAKSAKVQLEQ
ncbi:MAG: tripartite tricarboxylate transporter substrate binding protein [Burkholderiaceae bacterium]